MIARRDDLPVTSSGAGCAGSGSAAGGISGGSSGSSGSSSFSGIAGGPGPSLGSAGRKGRVGFGLHRSNSSLELPHSPEPGSRAAETPLRREYGSHGSIDVAAQSAGALGENLFAMLQDLRPLEAAAGSEQQPGSLGFEYTRRLAGLPSCQNVQQLEIDEVCGLAGHHAGSSGTLHAAGGPATGGTSPKLRLKINRLWGAKSALNTGTISSGMGAVGGGGPIVPTIGGQLGRTVEENCTTSSTVSADVEERHRRRAFAHYDCQSLTANLGYAAKLRGMLLARRRNTATGASAASSLRASTPDEAPEEDSGDGKENDLLESCPFFRNEIGGEGEREVGLTRSSQSNGVHRPSLSYGVAVLEPAPGETLWKHTCPFQRRPLPIESVDEGAHYYRRYFLGREHQNWFGMDEQLGPVAISIRKDANQYRIIVRTSELLTLRGSVPEEALSARPQARLPTRELLDLIAPEVQLGCLRLGTAAAEEAVARLDEQGLSTRYKVGVLYCKSGQRTEEEMYNNQHAGPAFLEFLDAIGQRIRLRGFEGYKAGLDTRTDSTGTHAVAATHRGTEITFHVSTMLPFTPNNRQQLLRKRHIGNDIVTIVFQEPGALPFSPRRIRSQFQHVFIVVRAINPCSDSTQYSVAVSRSKEVPVFGPPIPADATFTKGKAFTDFVLAKVINAENAAHRSEKFATMATRTRQEYLKDLAANYSSSTVVDTGQKFSMLSFSSKKKNTVRARLSCDASQRGALCWQVILEDSNQNTDCYLGISVDTIVLIEEHSRQIVFVTACIAVLGWHAQTNSLRLYYHQGECITIHVRADYGERDELMEIVARLRAVTQGAPATELSLKRNTLGQLGFHVQPDGVITQVESMGLSWQAGLRQGARLVEICKIAVSTLSHDQMVDLLKTSAQVTVTVIPAHSDGTARRGCTLQNCQYLVNNYEGDYENLTSPDSAPSQQAALPHQRRYERSFSPPRSSNSSGYGTGSSSRSFGNDSRLPLEGTITSSSSGHSSTDDRWYELSDAHESVHDNGYRQDGAPPPPVPTRYAYPLGPIAPNQKKEKEAQYASTKQFTEHAKHHFDTGQDQYPNVKECNYLTTKPAQENGKQENCCKQLESVHRCHECSGANYASFQKDVCEPKPENPYASQRELQLQLQLQLQFQLQKADANYHHHHHHHRHHPHQHQNAQPKLGTSMSVPLANNSGQQAYSLSKANDAAGGNEAVTGIGNGTGNDTGSDHCNGNNSCSNSISRYGEYEKIQPSCKLNCECKYGDPPGEHPGNFENSDEKTMQEKFSKVAGVYEFCRLDEPYGKSNGKHEIEVRRYELEKREINERSCEKKQQDEQCGEEAGKYDAIHELKAGEKLTSSKNIQAERSVAPKVSVEYRQTKDPSSSLPSEINCADISSQTFMSEDEHSAGSGSVSPRLRRASNHRTAGNLTPSSSGSRNQSPRPKPNVRNSQRNSANLASSTLQEDLMKLINPDYLAEEGQVGGKKVRSNVANDNNPSTNKLNNNLLEIQNKCRSRERLCGNTTSGFSVLAASSQENGNSPSEVILTMARPATVISSASTASSPAPSEMKLSKEERLSPRVTKSCQSNTKQHQQNATSGRENRAYLEVEAGGGGDGWERQHAGDSSARPKGVSVQDWNDDRYIGGCNAIGSAVSDLQSHLSTLELRVARETRRRLSLEDEVRRLRDENRRLQDESHAAAQQLRRFTEWFFQTIDHQ